jgi:hypothetical protein
MHGLLRGLALLALLVAALLPGCGHAGHPSGQFCTPSASCDATCLPVAYAGASGTEGSEPVCTQRCGDPSNPVGCPPGLVCHVGDTAGFCLLPCDASGCPSGMSCSSLLMPASGAACVPDCVLSKTCSRL